METSSGTSWVDPTQEGTLGKTKRVRAGVWDWFRARGLCRYRARRRCRYRAFRSARGLERGGHLAITAGRYPASDRDARSVRIANLGETPDRQFRARGSRRVRLLTTSARGRRASARTVVMRVLIVIDDSWMEPQCAVLPPDISREQHSHALPHRCQLRTSRSDRRRGCGPRPRPRRPPGRDAWGERLSPLRERLTLPTQARRLSHSQKSVCHPTVASACCSTSYRSSGSS